MQQRGELELPQPQEDGPGSTCRETQRVRRNLLFTQRGGREGGGEGGRGEGREGGRGREGGGGGEREDRVASYTNKLGCTWNHFFLGCDVSKSA